MTSLILSAVCALALSSPVVSPQSDTTDLFFINAHNIVTIDNKELAGKTIKSYTVIRRSINGQPVRAHMITTTDYPEPSVSEANGAAVPSISIRSGASFDPMLLKLMGVASSVGSDEEEMSASVRIVTDDITVEGTHYEPKILLRNVANEDIPLFIVDDSPVSEQEFKQLDPRKIESITVLKDGSSIAKLTELKAKGKYDGEVSGKGVVLVTTKKGTK